MGSRCSISENNKSVDAKKLMAAIESNDMETLQILQTVPVISSLNRPELMNLSNKMTKRSFQKDGFLMKIGDMGEEFFLILSGKVQVLNAKGFQLNILEAGDYVGEQSLLTKQPRNASIQCLEEVETLVCSKTTFNDICTAQTRAKFAERDNERAAVLTTFKDVVVDDEKRDTEKSHKVAAWLDKCVADTLLFKGLPREVRLTVITQMYREQFKEGTKIIQQGEAGNTFYVLESGKVSIYIGDKEVSKYDANASFGGLALMYNSPRAATVVATEDCVVWTVTRGAFRTAVRKAQKEYLGRRIKWLKKVKFFRPLQDRELQNVNSALEQKSYKAGTVLIKEGEQGDRFYLIKRGKLEWSTKKGAKGVRSIGEFVGERALLTKAARGATVTCKEDTTCLELSAEDFRNLLGTVAEKMIANIKNENLAAETTERKEDDNAKAIKVLGIGICGLSELQTIGFLGKGAFGRVTLVVDPESDKSYALKAVRKDQIVKAEQESHIVNEKDIMLAMSSPFLVNLRATYKDKLRVYFLLDACLGGELFTILRKKRYFDEDTSRFFAGCVIEAFDYMHSNHIVYRDLKPENLVLANDGYLKVTDFGFAKKISDKTFTLCGTPDYLAPEIVTGQGHSFGVDWWTLGILIYEMLASFPPFYADQPINIYRNIVRCKVKYPRYLTKQAKEMISAFLKGKATKRLGILYNGDVDRIRSHPWFKAFDFDWKALQSLKMKPPIQPKVKGNRDIGNFKKRQMPKDDAKEVSAAKAKAFDSF